MTKPADGLTIYESRSEALASLMGVKLSGPRKKIIESAHAKKVWVGITEGYEHLESEDDPRMDEKEESGYDDIEESYFPKIEKPEGNDNMKAIAEMMDSPTGEGLQKKSVGKDGMPQEKTDLKDKKPSVKAMKEEVEDVDEVEIDEE